MIKPLTSLRFFFALTVFLRHYHYDGRPLLELGSGMSFFFILSGFILAYTYKNRMLSGEISKSKFYVGRLARIYPLHLLTIALLVPILLVNHQIPDWKIICSNVLLLQSWIPIQACFFSLNEPSWSLSVCVFLYLVFPALLGFLVRPFCYVKTLVITGGLAIYAGMLWLLWNSAYAHAFLDINPVFRLFDFGIGVALFVILEQSMQQRWSLHRWQASLLEISAVGLFLGVSWLSKYVPEILTYACYYWLPVAALLCVFALQQKGIVSELLSKKALVLGGKISFGIYMFHIPIMKYGRAFFEKMKEMTGLQASELMQFMVILTAILIISYWSFRYVEPALSRVVKKGFAFVK